MKKINLYDVSFKMFNSDGLNAQFRVRADGSTEHINALTEYLNALSIRGWSVNELEPNKVKVTPELVSAYDTLNALGYTFYREEWNGKLHKACAARGFQSLNDVPLNVMTEMITSLETKLRSECEELSINMTTNMLQNLVNEFDNNVWSIGAIQGIPLANLLKELRLPHNLVERALSF